jgi:hypothetical protein
MKLTDIKNLTNTRLAGEQLTYSALVPYFDAVIDDINEKLHTCFKTFSEFNSTGLSEPSSYDLFPDKYIRTVVCIGAAAKWYVDDEEGIETATALAQQYQNNLFVMMRDYGPLVPDEWKRDDEGGFLKDPASRTMTNNWNPEIRYVPVEGLPGASVENMKLDFVGDKLHLFAKVVGYTIDGGYKWIDCGSVDITPYYVRVNQTLPVDATIPKNTIGFEIEDVEE